MKFDLHIHSCLSPCANLEMSPSEIVARAVAAGMGGIALTDHQSARNTPAIAACARRAAAELPLPEGDEARVPAENVAVVPNDDGTATVTVPHAADAPRMFYAVEAGD